MRDLKKKNHIFLVLFIAINESEISGFLFWTSLLPGMEIYGMFSQYTE